jgi:PAS domain S-box-containing protein
MPLHVLRKRWYLLGTLCGVLLWLFSLYIAYRYNHQRFDSYVHQTLQTIVDGLESNIERQLSAIHSLHAFLEYSSFLEPRLPRYPEKRDLFERFAAQLKSVYTSLRAIEYTTPEFRIEYVYPLKGNEAALGLDLKTRPSPYALEPAQKALSYYRQGERQIAVSRPFQLVQGNWGMTAFLAVEKNGQFAGFAEIVFDLDDIAKRLFTADVRKRFSYRVSLADQREPIWQNGTIGKGATARVVHIGDRIWSIEIVPTFNPFLHSLFLFIGFVTLLLASNIFLAWKLYFRTRTEQKRLADLVQIQTVKLERQRSYFQTLLANLPVAIALLDQEGKIRLVNARFEALFGYPADEAADQTLEELIVPSELRGEVRRLNEKALQGERLAVETWRLNREGRLLPVSLIVSPILTDGERRIYHIYEDISSRKRVEQALRDSEKQYRNLIELSNDAIYIVQDERFVLVNRKFTEIFGYTLEDMHRQNLGIFDLVAPESRPLIRKRVEQRKRGETPPPIYRFTAQTRTGEKREVEVSLANIEWKGRPAVQGILRDVTEFIRLEQQLQQAQRLEAIGKLAGGIAHDFNNMLTVISGNCDLLLLRPDLDDEIRQGLREIQGAADRAAHLTRQLLAYGRKQVLKKQKTDLNYVIYGIRSLLESLLEESISLQFDLQESLPPVEVDARQIEQVLVNLCVNARDAIREWEKIPGERDRLSRGEILIETREVLLDDDYVQKHIQVVPGRYVLLSVTDNGVGMDAKTKDHIFDPFFTTKEMGRGTGLGLASVYGIIKQHRGYIWVYSEPQKGATFKIYLPVAEEGEKRRRRTGRNRASSANQGKDPVRAVKVLLVEDNSRVREMTVRMLEQLGYQVISFDSPIEALEHVKTEKELRIDLLITDVIMPQMSGHQLANEIQDRFPEIKTLFISGYSKNALQREAYFDVEINYLQKPFSIRDLQDKLNALFGQESGDLR